MGRLVRLDEPRGVPAVYDLMTVPRGVPRGGALGGLVFDAEGIEAVYGGEILDGEGRRWPAREPFGPPDRAFR